MGGELVDGVVDVVCGLWIVDVVDVDIAAKVGLVMRRITGDDL